MEYFGSYFGKKVLSVFLNVIKNNVDCFVIWNIRQKLWTLEGRHALGGVVFRIMRNSFVGVYAVIVGHV